MPRKNCFLSLLTIFYPTFLIIPRLFLIRCHINICKLIYKTSQICSISWLRPWLRRMRGLRGSGPSSGESSGSGSGRRVPWGATTQSIARVTGTRPETVKTSDYTEWCCDNDNWSCNNIIQTICLGPRVQLLYLIICLAPHRLVSVELFMRVVYLAEFRAWSGSGTEKINSVLCIVTRVTSGENI